LYGDFDAAQMRILNEAFRKIENGVWLVLCGLGCKKTVKPEGTGKPKKSGKKSILFACESYLIHSQRYTCAAQCKSENPSLRVGRERSSVIYSVYFRKHRRTDFLLCIPVCTILPPAASMLHTDVYHALSFITRI